MNDNELDEVLNQWKAPLVPASLRGRLQAGFAARPRRAVHAGLLRRLMDRALRLRIGRLAVAAMAAAAVVFAIIQVSPRTVRMESPEFRIPFYVEFEFARYPDDGSSPHPSLVTSFPYGRQEIVVSVMEAGNPLFRVFQEIANSIRVQFILAAPSFALPKNMPMAEPAWSADFVSSGCSAGTTVVGHEIIAGHQTTVVQSESPATVQIRRPEHQEFRKPEYVRVASPGHRTKIWMSPDLACFVLKVTDEVQQADGTYRLILRREALKVTMNP